MSFTRCPPWLLFLALGACSEAGVIGGNLVLPDGGLPSSSDGAAIDGSGPDDAAAADDASSNDDAGPNDDAVTADATEPVDGAADADVVDAELLDGGGNPDASQVDGATTDGATPDGGAVDSGAPDTGPADSGVPACSYSVQRPAASASWTPTGPPGGLVSAVLALGGNALAAGTRPTLGVVRRERSTGLYWSNDGGQTFTVGHAFFDVTVRNIVRVNGGTRLYAAVSGESGSPDDGIWVSNDSGHSWSLSSTGLHTSARPRRVVVAAGQPERLYAVVEGTAAAPFNAITSLYRRDGSGDWVEQSATGLNPDLGGPALALEADPTVRDGLMMADGARFYSSTDAGASFTPLDLAPFFAPSTLRPVNGLRADPSTPGRLLLSTNDIGVFESLNGGASWSWVRTPAAPILDIGISATATWLATRGQGLWVSRSGSAYAQLSGCLLEPVVGSVSEAPDNANQVFAGTYGGGVFHSVDRGLLFQPQQAGIDEAAGRMVVTHSASADTAWMLSTAGLFRLATDHRTWNRIETGTVSRMFSDLALDPADPNIVLLGTDQDLSEGGGPSVGVVRLTLSSGARTTATGFVGSHVARVVFDPSQPTRVFAQQKRGVQELAGLVQFRVFVSNDRGQSFSPTPMIGFDVTPAWDFPFPAHALELSAAGTVVAGSWTDQPALARIISRSTDHGGSFTETWSEAMDPDFLKMVSGLYLDPSGNIVFAGRSQTQLLWRSTDQAQSFNSFGTGLPSGVLDRGLDLAFTASGSCLVGTSTGAYFAANGLDFNALTQGLPAPPPSVYSVAILPGTPPLALIGTVKTGPMWMTLP